MCPGCGETGYASLLGMGCWGKLGKGELGQTRDEVLGKLGIECWG